jgi:hypothetical protein
MDIKSFSIGIIIIAIPLILIVLWYRYYIYNYCKYDLKCFKNRLLSGSNKNKPNQSEEEIEGFFGGIGNWFSGNSPPTNLPVSAGTVGNENLSSLERKINDKMSLSTKFPPSELNGNSDDFKDSDNSDILKSIGSKPYTNKPLPTPDAVFSKNNTPPPLSPPPPPPVQPKLDVKSLLGSCQFFNDKCPDNHYALGNFSIEGVGSNSILSCGNVQNTKPAKAVAQIKNNTVYEIHITDPGHGFTPNNVPKVSIEGGKGHGATAEAVIDDDGFLKLIKVINPGYNYSETPNVLIDAPFMNSSCHLCCKENPGSL